MILIRLYSCDYRIFFNVQSTTMGASVRIYITSYVEIVCFFTRIQFKRFLHEPICSVNKKLPAYIKYLLSTFF